MTKNELIAKYKHLNVAEKLIVINTIVFVLFNLISFLFQTTVVFDWFVLSKDFTTWLTKPWSVFNLFIFTPWVTSFGV